MKAARAILFDPFADCINLLKSPILIIGRLLTWMRCRLRIHLGAEGELVKVTMSCCILQSLDCESGRRCEQ